MTLQDNFLNIFGHLMKHPLIEFFHLSNLLQMQHDHRKVDIEFFSNFSCSYKRISSMMTLSCHQILMAGHYVSHLQGSHLICKTSWTTTLANWSLAVPRPNALLMVQVFSTALWPILNSNKKIVRICILSNLISTVWNEYKINSK